MSSAHHTSISRVFSPSKVFDLQALHVCNITGDSTHPLHGCALSTHGSMLAPLLLAVCKLCSFQHMHYIYYSFCSCGVKILLPWLLRCPCVHADWPCAPAAAYEAAAKAANILLPLLSHPSSKQASSLLRLLQHRPVMTCTCSCPDLGPWPVRPVAVKHWVVAARSLTATLWQQCWPVAWPYPCWHALCGPCNYSRQRFTLGVWDAVSAQYPVWTAYFYGLALAACCRS